MGRSPLLGCLVPVVCLLVPLHLFLAPRQCALQVSGIQEVAGVVCGVCPPRAEPLFLQLFVGVCLSGEEALCLHRSRLRGTPARRGSFFFLSGN